MPGRSSSTSDPTRDLWRRLRRPLGVVLLIGIVIQNRDRLTSGQALPTAFAVVLIVFCGWLFLRSGPSFDVETVTGDELRATNRKEIVWWTCWALIAAGLVVWASAVNGFQPRSLILVAVPVLPLLGSVFVYWKADAIVAKAAARRLRS